MTEPAAPPPPEVPDGAASDAISDVTPAPAPRPTRKTTRKAKPNPASATDGVEAAPSGGGSWIRQSDGTLKRNKD